MRIIIQLVVIIVALGVVIAAIAGKQTHSAKAWKKIALCILSLVMIVAVLFPNSTNVVAHMVGVGRGADLLLYILTLAFIGYVINSYLREQRDREILHKLARRLALYEANIKKKDHKK